MVSFTKLKKIGTSFARVFTKKQKVVQTVARQQSATVVPVVQQAQAQVANAVEKASATVVPLVQKPQLNQIIEEGELASEGLFSFAKKHPFKTADGEISADGLALCRMDNYDPVNGMIRCRRDAVVSAEGIRDSRNSVHFSLNQAVKAHLCSWDDCKNLFVMPFRSVENIIGGNPIDIYTKGSVRIPKGAVIVRQSASVPSGRYRIKNAEAIQEFKDLQGVRVIETGDTPHAASSQVLRKLGYFVKDSAGQSHMCTWNGQVDETFIRFMQKEGKFLAAHTYTPNCKVEQMLNMINIRAKSNREWTAVEDITSALGGQRLIPD